jgi:hypothetical protein
MGRGNYTEVVVFALKVPSLRTLACRMIRPTRRTIVLNRFSILMSAERSGLGSRAVKVKTPRDRWRKSTRGLRAEPKWRLCIGLRDLNSLIAINCSPGALKADAASCDGDSNYHHCHPRSGNICLGNPASPHLTAIELLIFPQNALILLVGETGTLCEWCITGPRISGI